MDSPTHLALRARYVMPVTSPPIEGGVVRIVGERIAGVDRAAPGELVHDLGNVAILPGLVNAHTHLEFSDLTGPLAPPGGSFAAWIRRVIEFRRTPGRDVTRAVERGLDESLAAGVTTIGEIASGDAWEAFVPATPPASEIIVFHELIGLAEEHCTSRLQQAASHLTSDLWQHPHYLQAGLSPHAPYTVHPKLLDQIVLLSRERRVPVAMHLAESTDEIELLATGQGPLVELLEALGAWDPDAIPNGSRPLDYLRRLEPTQRVLVIHGTCLDTNEIDWLAERDHFSVVFCPRTHALLGQPPHPVESLLRRRVRVALGTDSRASNPDLSLLEEMRFVARRYPGIAPAEVLGMGTAAAAESLGLAGEMGSLEPGKLANLAVVPLPERRPADPHELLFDSTRQPDQTWWRGRRLA